MNNTRRRGPAFHHGRDVDALRADSLAQRDEESDRRWFDVPAVDPHDHTAALFCNPRELADERRLADAARAAQVECSERKVRRGQRRTERLDLGGPPDESHPPCGGQPVGDPVANR